MLPLVGNLVPSRVSFLVAMRYYAGNWAWNAWLFEDSAYEKLSRFKRAAPLQREQLAATMPPEVRRIADRHLDEPALITIESETATVDTVEQHYLIAPWRQKLDAMTRILETTDFNAMLIFVRTKVATLELSEKLEARGHSTMVKTSRPWHECRRLEIRL